MPSDAEREDVCRQAAEHLQLMIQLRRSARATQIEQQVRDVEAIDEFEGDDSKALGIACFSQSRPGLVISALDDAPPFEPHSRTFLLPMSDDVLQLFTGQAAQLRKLTRLTKCSIELRRSVLLRKRSKGGGWIKYAKIVIRGLTIKNITTLDDQLKRKFPLFLNRRLVGPDGPSGGGGGGGGGPACCLFVSECLPDNADLPFGNQRLGGVRRYFGALRLPDPGGSSDSDQLGDRRARLGSREPSRTRGFSLAANFLHGRSPRGGSVPAK